MKIKAFNNRRGKGLEIRIADWEFHEIRTALMFFNKRKDRYFENQMKYVNSDDMVGDYTVDMAFTHGWWYCCTDLEKLFENVMTMFENEVDVDEIKEYITGGFCDDTDKVF